jgi:hypothetical protein
MRKIVKQLIRCERGVVLIVVLILLAVGGLTLAPMLQHMGTGLKAGQVYERKTNEYYAADAGVEDALWQITREDRDLHLPDDEADLDWNYTITDVNGKIVDVNIDYVDESEDGYDVYKVISVAGADSSDTTIECYAILGGGFCFLLDNVITSPGDVSIGNNSYVEGEIVCEGTLTIDPGAQTPTDTSPDDPIGDWPKQSEVSGFYYKQVDPSNPFLFDTIDLNGIDLTLSEPIYREGNLKITNSSSTPATLTLEDTIYVTGNLDIQNTKTFTIELNKQTIYVNSNSAYPPGAINISDKQCIIQGSGCIISAGDIYFKPDMNSSLGDFIFIMSINGEVQFQPQADFYGSVAGDVLVDLQPNCSLIWSPPPLDLNFPGYSEGDYTGYDLEVRTWQTSE